MLLLMLLLGYTAPMQGRGTLCALYAAVSWEVWKESVGFMVLVRVQAVILLSTYLVH